MSPRQSLGQDGAAKQTVQNNSLRSYALQAGPTAESHDIDCVAMSRGHMLCQVPQLAAVVLLKAVAELKDVAGCLAGWEAA